jgi:hypothetical protein
MKMPGASLKQIDCKHALCACEKQFMLLRLMPELILTRTFYYLFQAHPCLPHQEDKNLNGAIISRFWKNRGKPNVAGTTTNHTAAGFIFAANQAPCPLIIHYITTLTFEWKLKWEFLAPTQNDNWINHILISSLQLSLLS